MVIGDDGEQLGVMSLSAALDLAAEKKLDLVEVAPNANPIVCKIMDYGKFKYDKEKKAKEAKKNQKVVVVKEIKFKSRIDKHDFDTKVAKISKFLEKEYKVKVSLMLFGRERMHSEIGINLLEQVAEIFADKAIIDKKYNEAQKFLMLSPKKQ
ncbi:MAG: translation initiation factor [Fusobacteriaceae bacterium]|nr:translation initiation factor [Fusobacteriaceae bacterium]